MKKTIVDLRMRDLNIFVGGSYKQPRFFQDLKKQIQKNMFIPIIAKEWYSPPEEIHDYSLILLHLCKYAFFDPKRLDGGFTEIERATDYKVTSFLLYDVWEDEPDDRDFSRMVSTINNPYVFFFKYADSKSFNRLVSQILDNIGDRPPHFFLTNRMLILGARSPVIPEELAAKLRETSGSLNWGVKLPQIEGVKPIIDTTLEILQDGEWHSIREIMLKTRARYKKIRIVLDLFVDFNLIELNKRRKKAKASPYVVEFLEKIRSIEKLEDK